MDNFFNIFGFNHTVADFEKFKTPWKVLENLAEYIRLLGNGLDGNEYDEVASEVWVHKSAKIAPSAYLGAPCIIGENTEVRHCAFIRGSAIIGRGCVIGNSTEIKNAVLFDGVQVPHFNYVGDSILGYRAHLGAGVVLSNVRCDKSPVKVNGVSTGCKKLGALIGDNVEVGCNSVINPGTVIGKNTVIYPLSCVCGVIAEGSVYRDGTVLKRE